MAGRTKQKTSQQPTTEELGDAAPMPPPRNRSRRHGCHRRKKGALRKNYPKARRRRAVAYYHELLLVHGSRRPMAAAAEYYKVPIGNLKDWVKRGEAKKPRRLPRKPWRRPTVADTKAKQADKRAEFSRRYKKEVGLAVRELITEKGWSLMDCARHYQVSPHTLRDWAEMARVWEIDRYEATAIPVVKHFNQIRRPTHGYVERPGGRHFTVLGMWEALEDPHNRLAYRISQDPHTQAMLDEAQERMAGGVEVDAVGQLSLRRAGWLKILLDRVENEMDALFNYELAGYDGTEQALYDYMTAYMHLSRELRNCLADAGVRKRGTDPQWLPAFQRLRATQPNAGDVVIPGAGRG